MAGNQFQFVVANREQINHSSSAHVGGVAWRCRYLNGFAGVANVCIGFAMRPISGSIAHRKSIGRFFGESEQ
jgi:hypothetical protein